MTQVALLIDYETDPRPDIDSDHGLWVALLTTAKSHGEEIFGILHCLRCGGAGLQKNARSGLRIVPGEWGANEYNEFRDKYLRPNADAIKAILAQAAKVDIKSLTSRDDVIARIKGLEPRLRNLGWTDQDIWAEKEFEFLGRRRRSLFAALISDPAAEIGEITPEHAQFVFRYPNGREVRTTLYRVTPYEASLQPQISATIKKEATA